MSYNANKAALQYDGKLQNMVRQAIQADTKGVGSTLTAVIAGMRDGTLVYGPNKTDASKSSWKGHGAYVKLVNELGWKVNATFVTKVCKVVTAFMFPNDLDPNGVVDCDEDDVLSYVLRTITEHGSFTAAYAAAVALDKDDDDESEGPKAWDMDAAIRTLVQKAKKEGKDPVSLQFAVENMVRTVYGS